MAASRRAVDLLWVTLAAAGVVLLAHAGDTAGPGGHDGRGVPLAGIAFALAAAAAGPRTSCSARRRDGASPDRPAWGSPCSSPPCW